MSDDPWSLKLPNLRSCFLPDPGFALVEGDLARADAQVIAWEAEAAELKRQLAADEDIHSDNADMLYGHVWRGRKLVRTRDINPRAMHTNGMSYRDCAKRWVHGCLTPDHDVLTMAGWVPITEKPNFIMCYDKSGQLLFETVSGWFDDIAATTFYEWNEYSFSQKVTHHHKFLYSTDDKGVRCAEVQDLPKSACLPKSGKYYSGITNISEDMARLYCAVHADGSKHRNRWRFHLKKERKVERLHKLLSRLNIEFSFSEYEDGTSHTSFEAKIQKPLSYYILAWPQDALSAYVDEAKWWDGVRGESGRKALVTADRTHAEWFATMAHLTGKASQTIERARTWEVSVNNRPLFHMTPPERTINMQRVLCPKTPTGFFLVRRNNVISVTGNTNFAGGSRTLASVTVCPEPHVKECQTWWCNERHPEIGRLHRRVDFDMKSRKNPVIHNRFGFRRLYVGGQQGRSDNLLGQALAWIAQSTVAIVINTALRQIDPDALSDLLACTDFPPWGRRDLAVPEFDYLLQIHDSILGQVRLSALNDDFIRRLDAALAVTVPYDDPLVIGREIKWSAKSWGAMTKWKEGTRLVA